MPRNEHRLNNIVSVSFDFLISLVDVLTKFWYHFPWLLGKSYVQPQIMKKNA